MGRGSGRESHKTVTDTLKVFPCQLSRQCSFHLSFSDLASLTTVIYKLNFAKKKFFFLFVLKCTKRSKSIKKSTFA